MGMKRSAAPPMAALASRLLLTPPVSTAAGSAGPAHEKAIGSTRYVRQCRSRIFELVLGQRRAQIDSKRPLPNLPGQALYLARNDMMSTYKDLTDALPSKIGRPNKFKIPAGVF